MKNGVLIRKNLPTDWISGQETGITFVENVKDAQWDNYLPTDEKQSYPTFDTSCCVTFSALNCVETLLKRLLTLKLIPEETKIWLDVNGYFDDNGNINFSDRFSAKMSGTTVNGNYLGAVWDSIRNDGLLPEKDYLFYGSTWNEYMSEIPQNLKNKALKFKEKFNVMYEWITIKDQYLPMVTLSEHLKQSPIQVATATCMPWNTDQIINGCGIRTNHATMIYGFTDKYTKDYDTYNPFRKKWGLDYAIPYAIKAVIECKQLIEKPKPVKYTFLAKMELGQHSSDIVALQDLLKKEDCFPLTVNSTGYYGEITRQAVLKFQKKYKVANAIELAYVNGKWCGAKTLQVLNQRSN
jgi:hypothetical protein